MNEGRNVSELDILIQLCRYLVQIFCSHVCIINLQLSFSGMAEASCLNMVFIGLVD